VCVCVCACVCVRVCVCVCGIMVNVVRCIFALEMCEVGSRTVMRENPDK